jgi:23S rRNA pseudouridine1911/1915/1917 synthase
MHHCQSLKAEEFEDLRPGIVHRLDKDTSGVLVAAKTREAHQKLIEQFALRTPEKEYLVICCGVPKEGRYSAPIKRHPVRRKEMTVGSGGKEAITEFEVLARRDGLSIVKARLITGRTHQIRVHLKSMNCPVLGDPVYGSSSLNQKYKVHRQMLHAHKLVLQHPLSETSLEWTAPVPDEMKNFIELIAPA